MAYLTKSRFKLALDCPPKLYYGSNKTLYADQNKEDPFLIALAEGGYQVGELAKYLFCNDPIAADITIDELGYQEALDNTNEKRAAGGRVVIAEAAFQYQDFFVRTDLIVEENDYLHIYEVKAKSWDEKVQFLKPARKKEDKGKYNIDTKWAPYLYDIAFQKYVVQKANPKKKVRAHIILADKTQAVSINGLNQIFKIKKTDSRIQIEVQAGITQQDLGTIPLKVINVDEVCEWIYINPVKIDMVGEWGFEHLIYYLAEKYNANERIWSNCIGTKCKHCQYINNEYPIGLQSGFHECWRELTGLSNNQLFQPLILELWCGNVGARSIIKDAAAEQKYLLSQADESLYPRNEKEEPPGDTMDGTKRRTVQVTKSINNDFEPHLDRDGLRELFDALPAPYHFIDFETTMVALPFYQGRQPYEAIAFQYSYHLMDEKGNIEHKNQYLSFERGVFPNYDFLRVLRNDLTGKPGTIFRYHQHENSYLNHIYKQLLRENNSDVADKEALMAFIREIAHPTNDMPDKWEPINDMQDLYKFVLEYFYSLYAKGSNSIKDILPAVIRSSDYMRNKYSQPVYATDMIPSLNFTEPHIWIDDAKGLNPYKTLPELFTDFDRIRFELEDSSLAELNNGGAAMMAYAYLQFTNMTEEQRLLYRNGLLRYCELDTMAMVMIWEYWGNEIGRW